MWLNLVVRCYCRALRQLVSSHKSWKLPIRLCCQCNFNLPGVAPSLSVRLALCLSVFLSPSLPSFLPLQLLSFETSFKGLQPERCRSRRFRCRSAQEPPLGYFTGNIPPASTVTLPARASERTNEQTKERTSERASERASDRTRKRASNRNCLVAPKLYAGKRHTSL